MEKRVVITGMGIWACIGKNTEEVTQSLREGRSGIGLDPARRELGYISSLTGIVEQPNLKGVLDRRKRLCLPQQGEYAYMATAEAMRNAGMDEAYLAANEVGIIYGNDSSAAPVIEGIDIIRARRNTAMVGSGNIFQSNELDRDDEPLGDLQPCGASTSRSRRLAPAGRTPSAWAT